MEAGGDCELIVVDNGSTDATHEVLECFAASAVLPVRIVHEAHAGLSNARNAGWRTAGGDIVAFTDDDCYPAADYLAALRDCFAQPDLGYVGARVLLYDRDDYPITIQPLNERVDIPAHSYVKPGLIHGANMAFRRAVLERIGGFDPALGAGTPCLSAEDTDALCRASAAGFAGAYDPRPVVYHHHGRRLQSQVDALLESYDVGRGALFFKGLTDGGTRRHFALPVARRVAGHLLKGRFATLNREMKGALRYARHAR